MRQCARRFTGGHHVIDFEVGKKIYICIILYIKEAVFKYKKRLSLASSLPIAAGDYG